ncbi:acyl-CoA dehydrogenase [Sphingomonas sp. CFBP 13720]|uniref:acyl-CoA dehydrogenase n=1 Tax=Sphingomonas sp. CFBP 13720 TaxID=2775302 RepID=UPI00177E7E47|nr:acyl-CoA dehydrogenase [Sphingomonas sp. CFBP 13720]MBD8677412.1 acyl-CoA dehydrogenase [Sphingomonas sp. CFBP 13720]
MTVPIGQALRDAIRDAEWDVQPVADPVDSFEWLTLLRTLYATGRRDLPLGRLLEGHVDAVQIVQRYGSDVQVAALLAALAGGATLGVWNAGLPGAGLRMEDRRLTGGKSHASGAGTLSHALATTDTPDGPQLLLLDLARVPPTIDRDWWKTTGMQRSETHLVRWQDAPLRENDPIGRPGDYPREPFFSGGALRFVAVHAGGVAALCDRTCDHLVATDRAGDPFQSVRLAELFALADTAAAAVRHVASRWFEEDGEARLARVAAARLTVTAAAERAIVVAREAVGLAGMFVGHPLAATIADLSVYLRQPAPDAQRLRVGGAVAARLLSPAL